MPDTINFLDEEEVLTIHRSLSGRDIGPRQEGLLRACLSLPSSKIGGRYAHQDLYEMAAAYLFQLVGTKLFTSHNRATAAICALYFLYLHGLDFVGNSDDFVSLVSQTAAGKTTKLLLADYLRNNCRKGN